MLYVFLERLFALFQILAAIPRSFGSVLLRFRQSVFFTIRAERSHCFFMSEKWEIIRGYSCDTFFIKTTGYLPLFLACTVSLACCLR